MRMAVPGPLLAGRTQELQVVSAVLSGQSRAAAVLICGDAGVGKSRLAAAASAVTQLAGVSVLTGWCLPLSEGLPLLPVIDVLRALHEVDAGRLADTALAECPAFVRRELSRLIPELAEPAEQSTSSEPVGAWQRQRLMEALRSLLAAVSTHRRVAMLIEDVHWADETTVDFFDYLLTPGHATGVPMLLTFRSDDGATDLVGQWLQRAYRNDRVQRLDLAPMSLTETAEQIQLLVGKPASPKLAAEIFARSEGNAFFTEQLLAARTADGADELLPPGLTPLLLSRTAHLSPAARDVVAALAVAARPLDEWMLTRLCDRSGPDVREALRDLSARRLLRRPDAGGRHQLRHMLLAEAISGDLLPTERKELHARVAEVLAESPETGLSAEVAAHFAAAGSAREELRWRTRAGHEAEALLAWGDAVGHFTGWCACGIRFRTPRRSATSIFRASTCTL
jgi:predicted ATPase